MDTVVLRGTAKERGLQQGHALRHRIRALSRRYRAICYDGLGDDRVVPVLRNMLRFVEKEFPEILEELEGIAEGGGLTLDVVARLNFGSAIGSAIRGRNVPGLHCSAVAFSDTPDGAIIGKNSDLDPAQASYYALKIVVPNAGLPYLGYGEVGGPWVEAGINAKGLALGQASGPVHMGQDGYGIPTLHSSHLALQYARSTREAVEFLSQIVHSGKGTSLMLADADGEVVAIERSLDRLVVRRPFQLRMVGA